MNPSLQDRASHLSPFGTKSSESRGRLVPEPLSATRTEFQRDRDRIIHSGAFRKLRNKTQVFIENEGDYYRTRLTHSLEVAQIARSVARVLGLDEDLTEAIALAHDLGHTCFGHAGEDGLAEAMQPFDGFSHNEQTFRILTKLENRYARFDGLNLTWETLEGVVKHNGPVTAQQMTPTLTAYEKLWDLELTTFAGPEAQVAAIADDIAYNTHDIDDGYRADLFGLNDLAALPLFGPAIDSWKARYPACAGERLMHEAVREVIGLMTIDLLETTLSNLAELKPSSAADIRAASKATVTLSEPMLKHLSQLREFLHARMYRHSKVNLVCSKARHIVKDLFLYFMKEPRSLPDAWYALLSEGTDDAFKARTIADYIAGMTDRFAVQEHRRLFSTDTMV